MTSIYIQWILLHSSIQPLIASSSNAGKVGPDLLPIIALALLYFLKILGLVMERLPIPIACKWNSILNDMVQKWLTILESGMD